MKKLQTMSYFDVLMESTNEDIYSEFWENKYSKRNKKQVTEIINHEKGNIDTTIVPNKKIFIFLDTCTWLNHAEKANFDALIKLVDLQRQYDATLLTPEQLTIEWDRNCEEVLLKSKINIFNDMLNKTKSFRDTIVSDDSQKQILDDLITQAETYKEATVTYISKEIMHLFEEVMKKGRKIKTKDEYLITAAKLALEKKAPFHKNKNSIGDAILFISLLDYLGKFKEPILYFLTDNTTDFSKENKVNELHPDLRKLAEENGITINYSLDLNKTLNEIIKEVTDSTYVKSYKEAYYQKYHVNFKNRCENKKCQGRMIMQTHPWDGMGEKIFYKCERCSYVEETNEYYQDYIHSQYN
ncbi:hypothetical protein CN556_00360 [Bacillus wiedmannii]|uniref:PIN domain-containing protein n=1 Tax=Bacillus wiedmannii TaxID=1890302 RepID=UPI000BEF817B|nr:PIN domain-containing protein [Bacillus wiedmannii]PEI34072.1 hypothetical protein CN644_18615 [Bacillus wiedmannii]PEL98016.1 hypothetical protein CN604_18085 [Bacillus wiedmannii]PEN99766.1 hypothetical protein CN556_00360 [Bacillus wiedmannii]PFZ01256.1 hypothetical protein COL75_20590 [Bacillus wiedmannii]